MNIIKTLGLYKLLIFNLLKNLFFFTFKKDVRTQKFVKSDYNYKRLYKKKFSNYIFKNIDEYLYSFGNNKTFWFNKNRFVYKEKGIYYQKKYNFLYKVIQKNIKPNDKIVEIGSGFGYNLFYLQQKLKKHKFIGYEVDKFATKLSNKVASRFDLNSRIKFFNLDLTKLNKKNSKELFFNKVVFSHFVFEQLPFDCNKVIKLILNSKPKRVILFEPIIQKLNLWNIFDLNSYFYYKRKGYVQKIYPYLQNLKNLKKIRIHADKRNPYVLGVNNFGSNIVIEPLNNISI